MGAVSSCKLFVTLCLIGSADWSVLLLIFGVALSCNCVELCLLMDGWKLGHWPVGYATFEALPLVLVLSVVDQSVQFIFKITKHIICSKLQNHESYY